MPRILEDTPQEQEVDTLNATMTAAEEKEALSRFTAQPNSVGDLTDGGKVGEARLYPMKNGMPAQKGRAAGRRAWTWDGSETTLTLAWNPDGTQHDGGIRYLRKKHCVCCNFSGFQRPQCPVCVRNNCVNCAGSTSQKVQKDANGKEFRGYVIPANYLLKEQVPFPTKFYGDIDCLFAPPCPRKGGLGFKLRQDMLMHASFRHRQEYIVRRDALAMDKNTENEVLKAQIAEQQRALNDLTALILRQQSNAQQKAPTQEEAKLAELEALAPNSGRAAARAEAFKQRMAKARAAKKQKEQSTIQ